MAARNDITGAEIKSGILSSEGRDNWDKAFAKKTLNEWLKDEPLSNAVESDDTTRISYKQFCELTNK